MNQRAIAWMSFVSALILYCLVVFFKAIMPVDAESVQVSNVRPQSKLAKCEHLYNVRRHSDWADCMGVGYRSKNGER